MQLQTCLFILYELLETELELKQQHDTHAYIGIYQSFIFVFMDLDGKICFILQCFTEESPYYEVQD